MIRALLAVTVSAAATLTTDRVVADPELVVTANHLGGGLLQYTLQVDNDLGGDVHVQISVQGNINQVQSVFSPDSPPDGGVSFQSQANVADMFDATYSGAGGMAADSWWDDLTYIRPDPPFNGHRGGAQGSMLFQYSAGTFGLPLGVPNLTFLGQIVILDARAAGLPIGATLTRPGGPIASFDIIDPSDPRELSAFSAAGDGFPIGDMRFGVPEPSTLTLTCLGLVGLVAYGWRRRL